MDKNDKQKVIRHLRGLLDRLESGTAELVTFERKREIMHVFDNDCIRPVPIGVYIESIHWMPLPDPPAQEDPSQLADSPTTPVFGG